MKEVVNVLFFGINDRKEGDCLVIFSKKLKIVKNIAEKCCIILRAMV